MLLKSKTPPKAVTVRTLHDADPDYGRALELRQTLRVKLSDLDAEEGRLHDAIAKSKSSAIAAPAAVAELLGDAIDDMLDPHGPRARLSALHAERTNVRQALSIAEQRLQTARFKASRAVMRDVGDIYIRRVRKIAETLIEAHRAYADLTSLVDELNAKDVAWSVDHVPLQPHQLFAARVPHWLEEVRRAGYIDKLPEGIAV